MSVIRSVLRIYAYLFHFLTGAFLLGIALVAYLTGVHNINSGGMVKHSGEVLSQCLLGIGLTGIISVALAALGKLRWVFAIYATLACFTMFRWFFASPYNFGSQEALQGAAALWVGSVGAMLASWTLLRRDKPARKRI